MTFSERFWRAGATVLVTVASASGCALIPGLRVSESASASGNGYQLVDVTASVIREQLELRALRDASVPPTGFSLLVPDRPTDEYIIGAGDVLTIVVWEHPELTNPTGEFRDAVSGGRLVSSDGTIFYPYVGHLKVAGKTVTQVRAEIAKALARVIRAPQVDVRVAAFRSQRVQVTGEVKQPGLVALDDTPKGVLEAICVFRRNRPPIPA